MYNTPHSSAMRSFLSTDFRRYVATRLCKSSPVRKRTLSTYLCWTNNKLIYIVRTRTKKPKNANKSIRVVDCSDQNNCFLISPINSKKSIVFPKQTYLLQVTLS